MIGKAIGAVFGALVALVVLMPAMQKNVHAVANGPLMQTTEQRAATHIAKNVFDWKFVFHRYTSFAFNTDPNARLMTPNLSRADSVGMEKARLSPTIHLALDELERGGLALRLTIEPGQRNDGANARLVLDNAMSK